MSGAFPEVARNGVALRPMGQGRAEVDLAFADGDGAAASSAFERCIERLEAVVDQDLPIVLSTKPDYSDFVDDKGRSIPRH